MAHKSKRSYEDCRTWATTSAVELKQYNYDTRETESLGEVSLYNLRNSMTLDQFTHLFDDMLNGGALQSRNAGVLVGENLRTTHRTLQGSAVEFALGLLAGISDQEFTDARNEQAIKTAKRITAMRENGELDYQPYI